jgi:hypothetical protein
MYYVYSPTYCSFTCSLLGRKHVFLYIYSKTWKPVFVLRSRDHSFMNWLSYISDSVCQIVLRVKEDLASQFVVKNAPSSKCGNHVLKQYLRVMYIAHCIAINEGASLIYKFLSPFLCLQCFFISLPLGSCFTVRKFFTVLSALCIWILLSWACGLFRDAIYDIEYFDASFTFISVSPSYSTKNTLPSNY